MNKNREAMVIKGMKWDYLDLVMDVFHTVELEVSYKGKSVFVLVSLSGSCETIIVCNHEILPVWFSDDGSLDSCTVDALYWTQADWQCGTDDDYTEDDMKEDVNTEIDNSEYKNAIRYARLAAEQFKNKYDYSDLYKHDDKDIEKSVNEFLNSITFPNGNLNSETGDNIPTPEYALPDGRGY